MSKKSKKQSKRGKKERIVLTETFSTELEDHPQSPLPAQQQARTGTEANVNSRPQYFAPNYRGSAKLQEKVALITGADSGIGRAVATLFAREGANVAIVYLTTDQIDAEETAAQIKAEGRQSLLIPGDVTKPRFCREAVEKTVSKFGKIDVLVNNAAYQNSHDSIEKISEKDFDQTFKTNIYSYFYMAKAALKYLEKGAVIINTGSITGLEGSNSLIDYSAAIGAVHAFTKSLAQNLVEKGIRVNCIAPKLIRMPFNVADKPAKKVERQKTDAPIKLSGQPENVAPAYVFFASKADSSNITGQVLEIRGDETHAA